MNLIGIHKCDKVFFPDVKLREDYLSLTYFQQWVVITLYYYYMHGDVKSASDRDLMMKACPSAITEDTSMESRLKELIELNSKKLIVLNDKNEYEIDVNGMLLAQMAEAKILSVLDINERDFNNLIKQIKDMEIREKLPEWRLDDNFASVKHRRVVILKGIMGYMAGWSRLLSFLSGD